MNRFLSIEKSMSGQYYICLCDNDGPIGRIEDWNYDTYEEAADYAEEIARVEFLRFKR